MKKFLMLGFCALAFIGCKDTNLSTDIPKGYNPEADVAAEYANAFRNVFGTPAANQTWGFGVAATATPAKVKSNRSATAPAVPGISAPYTTEEFAALLANAKEVTSATASQNWSGSSDFALEMKITGTWDGGISVAASEDWGTGDTGDTGRAHRNIYVTGTWNITDGQKIGGKGMIVIGDGGIVNVQAGTLEMVNQARIVVLQGGKLTGKGAIVINNGTAEGKEAYNGGLIDIATFNNNFGKFYNYGEFKVNEYQGGSQESNFYNHALVAIDHTSSTANARIFNNCQFYVENDARLRNYEGVNGSALIVGGQLLFSGSEDGTSTPTYVSLDKGALVKAGSLYNNGTSWNGPTAENEYAALEIVNQIDYLNWEQDNPAAGGYFANNIYVKNGNWNNVPAGNGYGQTDPSDTENYMKSIASYKFFNIVANCTGNGNVKKVKDGNKVIFPADEEFELGVKGCTPGFKIGDDEEEIKKPSLHVMAEDLTATDASDFDFNDVVIDVFYVDQNTVKIVLLAAGGTLPLRITENDEWEVHKLFEVDEKCMVNTGTKYLTAKAPYSQATKPYKELTLTGKTWSINQNEFAAQVRDQIKLEVKKNGQWHELTATQGDPAGKVATPVNIEVEGWYPEELRWTYERQSVKDFDKYVKDPISEKFYSIDTADEE